MKANPDLLMASRNERHPTELAQLFGMRLVMASETGQGRRLNETLVKDLTGGERIRARRMREDFWEFPPTHKVILSTNHKPIIVDPGHAIWRRLALVPFENIFWNPSEYPPEQWAELPADLRQDKQLGDKLRHEYPGILRWAVEGCLAWRRDGLCVPERVRVATSEYRSSQDVLACWIAERCDLHDGDHSYRVRASALYADYQRCAEHNGEEPLSQRAFGDTMTEKRVPRTTSNGTWYLGITLNPDYAYPRPGGVGR
jgi:putative DNA primase/helicase